MAGIVARPGGGDELVSNSSSARREAMK